MATLSEAAERARDLYNQDYPDRSEFFDLDDFKYHFATKYSSMLNQLYQLARRETKTETGYNAVEINPQWLINEIVTELKEDTGTGVWYIETSHDIFSFDYDSFATGMFQVRSKGPCMPKKISLLELPFHDIIPSSPDCYFYVEGKNKLEFLKKPSLPLTLYYIPVVVGADDNCVLSDNIVAEVIMGTLQLMFGAKTGNVIKESNDGNTNDVIQQQANPVLNKVQAQG